MHMTGNRFQLINFVQKFLGMAKFGNEHVAKIMGYGDCKIGNGLVRGLPKLKFEKYHLWSACAMGKSKKKSNKPKYKDTNQEKLYLLHMDLCGPMCVESVNGKKYILVIGDDNSRFTWVKCLRSKDEAPDFIIKFLKLFQVGISHETSVARSPQQNGVVERQVVATACYTLNRSIIRLHHRKIPYELLYNKLPDLSFLHVFGALCYPTNNSENLGKLQPKADIGIYSGYAPRNKAFWIYNRYVEEDIHDIEVEHMGNDPLFGVPIPEVTSAQSSLTVSPHIIVQPDNQIPQHYSKWTKDHPLDNIIGQLSRPVSIRLQLYEQALFCYYDAFLTSVEPKTYKDALTQSCWIEAMQEELNEFERLETAFLNGNLREEIYVSQPNGFVDQDNPNHVYKLKKALYGLKRAPCTWYELLSLFLISQDFSKVDTPIVEKSKLDKDKEGKVVDPSHYHAFAGADHAGCQDTRRSTSGSLKFLGERLISCSSKR
nr:hypothetical protein [Tanacetum cinerariifolium]